MTTADDPVTESEQLEPRVATTWRVRALRGPDQLAGPTAKLDLRQRELVVGSGEDCGLRLGDARVSRRHLTLRLTPFGVAVRDLGSTNGTFCRGLRVSELMLTQMAIVRVGRTDLEVLPAQVSGVLLAPKRFAGMVATSEAMRVVIGSLERSVALGSPLLLQGERGVGKQRAARGIATAAGALPFLRVDLACRNASEAIARLVTHNGTPGARLQGTLYLDHVASATPEAQAALMQLFQPGGLERVSIIASSQVDLAALVASGGFREDLYRQLAGMCITLPPLRDRPEDVSVVAFDLLGELGAAQLELGAAALEVLVARSWPGNVGELKRTLQHLMERSSSGASIALEDLQAGIDAHSWEPEHGSLPTSFPAPSTKQPLPPLKDAKQALVNAWEYRYLEELLKRHPTLSASARAAGITRVHLYRLLKRHGLDGGGEAEE